MVAARKKAMAVPEANSESERTRLQLMLGQHDRERIEDLCQKYDVAGGSDILRLAINLLANDIHTGKAPRKFVYNPDTTPSSMTTLWVSEDSRNAIKLIQEHYEMESLAAAVRLALVRLHRMWISEPDASRN